MDTVRRDKKKLEVDFEVLGERTEYLENKDKLRMRNVEKKKS